jgi:clorobiocin biosynthesis protein CloN4
LSAGAQSPARLRSLAGVLERGLSQSPDGPALRDGEREIGYAELDAMAARLAAQLLALGLGPGQRVAIWLPKSIEAIAAMQAALRIGAVYVPVDSLSPVERVERILADCRPSLCLAAAGAAAGLGAELAGVPLLILSGPGGEWSSPAPVGSLGPVAAGATDDDDPAYILYTSGSTGTPKGVCISHRNALAFVEWAHGELGAESRDRFSSHAPLHFDLSVLDLYVAFFAGACVCLVPEAISYIPGKLVEFVGEEGITIWYSVPSALMLMERAGLVEAPAALRAVLFAGEAFPIEPLKRLRRGLPAARFLNLYGPTETNVCTFHEVGEADLEANRPVPIGSGCSGDTVWIEGGPGGDRAGARGELVVAGPTVMLGYWGAPPQRGPYRTGDIVERLPEHGYRYLGRRDAMVKVRGQRVELGEVESAIAAHDDVLAVAVAVLGAGLESRLVAAVVARPGTAPGLLEIKRWCAARLPRYMIVHGLRLLPELPRSRNGKVDRRALEALLLGAEGEG